MKTAKTCTPKLWQQRSNYVNRQPIKTAKTCTPNRYALYFLTVFFYFEVVDVLRHNLTTSLLFLSFFIPYHKVNRLRHILTLPPHFHIFCLIIKIKCSPTYFDPSPSFLHFLSNYQN